MASPHVQRHRALHGTEGNRSVSFQLPEKRDHLRYPAFFLEPSQPLRKVVCGLHLKPLLLLGVAANKLALVELIELQ